MYALVDWNPAGVCIALTYKFGSVRMGREVRAAASVLFCVAVVTSVYQSPRFAVPALRWLGMRSEMLAGADVQAVRPLTRRDRAQANNMIRALNDRLPQWADELQVLV